MQLRCFVLTAFLLWPLPFAAQASTASPGRPRIAPPDSWITPANVPPAPASAEEAATNDLISDTQILFTNDSDTTYYGYAFKIASPQGLGEAALQVSWDPDIEALTLHRYRLIRDGKVLDLLGDGSKLSVLQREERMEQAALDGRLTATLQPDDVRVGDIVDIAYSRARRDPAMGGKSEALVGPRDGNPYGRVRFRMLWPSTKTMQWQALPGIVRPKLGRSGKFNELLADLSNVTPPRPPQGAPARFTTVNAIDISEFRTWGAVSAAMLPLYARASSLAPDSKVRAEAQRIAATTSDPKRRAELALALVEEQVRYLFLGMGDGGYVPAAADVTWSRRFGDCKAKTVLLIALLKELGIAAQPVLVNTEAGDLLAKRLPAMGAFDHVIVRADIGGRTYWMDGTRLGDTDLARLRTPAYHWALPVAAGSQALIPLTPEPLHQPSETVSLDLDASAGIDAPAPAKGEMRYRGESATDMRVKYAAYSAAEREQELRKLWRTTYDFVSPAKIQTRTEEGTGDFLITMTGTAKMEWFSDVGARWYELDRARLGWKFDTDRQGMLNPDAPFAISYPDFWESKETIKLPAGGKGFTLQGGPVEKTVGDIYRFKRTVGIDNGLLTMATSTVALAPELPAAKAERTRSEMAELATTGVYVRVPDDYVPTDADLGALKNNKAGLSAALAHRGAVRFDEGDLEQSLADEDRAIAIDPNNASAHAVRALVLALQQDARAQSAADRALALDDKQELAWRAKGIVALADNRFADADTAFSKYLELREDDHRVLVARASARLGLGRFDEALKDADAAAALSSDLEVGALRASALVGLGRVDEGLAEADRAVSVQSDDPNVRYVRARLRAGAGKRELALEDYNALIADTPEARYYVGRAALWGPGDAEKAKADVNAALRLEPEHSAALGLRAGYAIRDGAFAQADKDIAAIERASPDSRLALTLRLELLPRQGRQRQALQLIDSFVKRHPDDAMALNERCWTKATLNLEVESAVADCDASLKLSPDSAMALDSRGFAKLRLGLTEAAIADYDAALKRAPDLPASLFGRGIARSRKGDLVGAKADIAAARKLNPDIDRRFAGFGISLPAELAGSVQVSSSN